MITSHFFQKFYHILRIEILTIIYIHLKAFYSHLSRNLVQFFELEIKKSIIFWKIIYNFYFRVKFN